MWRKSLELKFLQEPLVRSVSAISVASKCSSLAASGMTLYFRIGTGRTPPKATFALANNVVHPQTVPGSNELEHYSHRIPWATGVLKVV